MLTAQAQSDDRLHFSAAEAQSRVPSFGGDTRIKIRLCTVSVEGLVEMKRTAGRDIDLIDIKNLGFEPNEQ